MENVEREAIDRRTFMKQAGAAMALGAHAQSYAHSAFLGPTIASGSLSLDVERGAMAT